MNANRIFTEKSIVKYFAAILNFITMKRDKILCSVNVFYMKQRNMLNFLYYLTPLHNIKFFLGFEIKITSCVGYIE